MAQEGSIRAQQRGPLVPFLPGAVALRGFHAAPDLLTRITHPADRAVLRQRLTYPQEAADQSIRDSRSLPSEISPPVLYGIVLEAAVARLLEQVRELLINVAKHAEAERATVRLRNVDEGVRIAVEDDGQGFDPAGLGHSTRNGNRGFGLFNIRERLEHLGGTVDIESSPSQGSRVVLTVPLKQPTSGREAGHGDQSVAG